ncbi:MAG: IS1595 family transposase, partial [Candidatus Solibacter sp.]|nr:IS1595 family transposase [Candidatus Solibacter sp.]
MGESTTEFEPSTLLEAIQFFSDPATCTRYLAERRWPDGPVCPKCGGKQHSYLSTRFLWKCRECKKQFSVKVGTIFEDSPLGLDKWLPAVWLLTSSRTGVSSMELHRSIGVTQKTAWFMAHRIRLALQSGSFNKAAGRVEVDETFIGQKARNMHKHIRSRKITTGGKDKTMVVGVLERGGTVRTTVVDSRKKHVLQTHVKTNVEAGAELFTDALKSYEGLGEEYLHQIVDHAVEYVKGNVHTNGMENFWSHLKRTIYGTYIFVMPFHLFRYLDEQSFRFN